MVDLLGFGTALLVPLGRSVGGWMTKSLGDGKISKFELRLLFETVLRTTILGTLIYFGAESFGIELEPVAAGVSAVLLDLVLSAFKKKK